MCVNGRSFVVEQFETGEGGHDPGNPTVALTPDVSITELPLQTLGPKAIDSKTLPDPFTALYVCKLTGAEAVGTLSNFLLIARINFSPIPSDPLVNTFFAYAIANLPMQNKLAGEEKEFDIYVNF